MEVEEQEMADGSLEVSNAKRLEILLSEQSSLLREASEFHFDEVLPQVSSLLYNGSFSFLPLTKV